MLTLLEQLRKHSFHLLESCDFLADVRESVSRYFSDRTATSPSFETQKFADFLEAEAKILRTLDETNPVDRSDWVTPNTASALWDRQ
jgi:hypothetical protein